MHYNLYFASKKLKNNDGIWAYAVYENNNEKILSDSKYVSLINHEFSLLPICAGLLKISFLYKESDLVSIMTKDMNIRSTIEKIKTNSHSEDNKYPIFNRYFKSNFYKFQDQIGFISIPSCWNYCANELFRYVRSYEYQNNLEKELKRMKIKFN